MRFFRILTVAAALTALSVGASYSQAGALTGLFNTGVDGLGAALPGGSNDTHYSVTSSPLGTGLAIVVGPPTSPTFPIPPWAPNSATFAWISGPNTVGTPPIISTPNGSYVYRTTFTATDTGIISIAGRLTADDQVTGISFNGSPAVSTTGLPTTDQGYASIFAFTAQGGAALVGVNTLDFIVNNTHNAVEGLQVSSLSGFTTVPEPLSIVMLGSGLVGIVGIGALRRTKKTAA